MALPGGFQYGPEIRFSVRREDWSKYEALDGDAIIGVRAVLVKLFELDVSKVTPGTVAKMTAGPHYQVSTQTIATAYFGEAMKGEPSAKGADAKSKGGQILGVTTIQEPWNEYLTAGPEAQIFRTKCIATQVRLFRKRFNAFGDPSIIVDSQVVIGTPRPAGPEELGA